MSDEKTAAAVLVEQLETLKKFKKYVHDRLDAAGVPADPEPVKNAEHGCRIEGRLNLVLNQLLKLTGPKCTNEQCEDGDGNHPYHSNIVERFWNDVHDSYNGESKKVFAAEAWGREARELRAKLAIVEETKDLKRARKRLYEKSQEVEKATYLAKLTTRQARIMVQNTLATVNQLCQLAKKADRTPEEEERLRGTADELIKVNADSLVRGHVKLIEKPVAPVDLTPPPQETAEKAAVVATVAAATPA